MVFPIHPRFNNYPWHKLWYPWQYEYLPRKFAVVTEGSATSLNSYWNLAGNPETYIIGFANTSHTPYIVEALLYTTYSRDLELHVRTYTYTVRKVQCTCTMYNVHVQYKCTLAFGFSVPYGTHGKQGISQMQKLTATESSEKDVFFSITWILADFESSVNSVMNGKFSER